MPIAMKSIIGLKRRGSYSLKSPASVGRGQWTASFRKTKLVPTEEISYGALPWGAGETADDRAMTTDADRRTGNRADAEDSTESGATAVAGAVAVAESTADGSGEDEDAANTDRDDGGDAANTDRDDEGAANRDAADGDVAHRNAADGHAAAGKVSRGFTCRGRCKCTVGGDRDQLNRVDVGTECMDCILKNCCWTIM